MWLLNTPRSLFVPSPSVALNTTADEDVWGAYVDADGHIRVTTKHTFSVAGASGNGSDVFQCVATSLGTATACDFEHIWQGTNFGFGSELMDGLSYAPSAPAELVVRAISTANTQDRTTAASDVDIEDFNNNDVDDNGDTAWVEPFESSAPTAVTLQSRSAASAQSMQQQTVALLWLLLAGLSGWIVKRPSMLRDTHTSPSRNR